MTQKRKESTILTKNLAFGIRIVKLHRHLCDKKKEYLLSRQLLRSGTSVGANLREAKYAQSRSDFISKNSIALKEAAETEYWLELLYQTDVLTEPEFNSIRDDCVELIKLLTAIIKTKKASE